MLYRSQQWLDASRNPDLLSLTTEKLHANARVCAKHFKDCFTNVKTKSRLVHNAVPEKNNDEVVESESSFSCLLNINSPTIDAATSASSSIDVCHTSDLSIDNINKHDQCIQATPVGYTPRKKELSKKLRNSIRKMEKIRYRHAQFKVWSKKWSSNKYNALKFQLVDDGIEEKSASFIALQVRLAMTTKSSKMIC